MGTKLRFEKKMMMVSELGEEASVPDLVGSLILQNDLEFHLDEEDEIYEGYGKRTNSYPYRQYNGYNRELVKKEVQTAILENDFIRAVFLPGLGGRLWELTDKSTNSNLLYTNDVIRCSNLATRNAWFSGGVEWNVAVIGHSPFTTEPLFTAELTDDEGNPVLRMYEYERIRGVEYQMDFWLGESDTYLNCRMRIVNSGKEVVPMYWWSNMAVPEYEGGRIVVPAEKAYTSDKNGVRKVDIPMVDGVDITCYQDIGKQVDYFFDISHHAPKFIANLDASGYGLLHISTQRLRSRKLFSWGNNEGSARWQDFLTEDGGRYVEIQAGLSKTQYGCIPMAPHTAWEWMEQYGAVRVEEETGNGGYDRLREMLTDMVKREIAVRKPEEVLKERKKTALTKGQMVYSGSRYGALKIKTRAFCGDRSLSEHLDYGAFDVSGWMNFLEDGIFMELSPDERPGDFMSERVFYERLKETIGSKNKDNWYAHYQLGIMHMDVGSFADAEKELTASCTIVENPWAFHGLASLYRMMGDVKRSREVMAAGIRLRTGDLGYVKEGFKLLLQAGGFKEVCVLYGMLPETVALESRILFDYMLALMRTGEGEKACEMLKSGFVLDDLREGEDSISDLWKELYGGESGTEEVLMEVPKEWNFSSL